ncbi:MAG TPA: phosphoribosylamine--glycine ligase [Polyangiaceae bacterium]|nr:phosphoribosylamine--glycine ligase [Polyangiaceae bacterium]
MSSLHNSSLDNSSLRKVLVVVSGGREHALAYHLLSAPSVAEVIVAPGNEGTDHTPTDVTGKVLRNAPGDVLELARRERPDLVVIGPEAPLCAGLTDELLSAGLVTFGPSRAAARLEGSKAFMKEFVTRHGIPTAAHVVVRSLAELEPALARFGQAPVVKADGLCAGKGVVVADTHEEARLAAQAMLSGESFGDAGRVVVLEERLVGAEASVHAICDGERFWVLPPAQDHKRIFDADRGPNTGGMGTYAPAPLVDPAVSRRVEERILAPTLRAMAAEGHPFRGTLFAGLMIAPDGEPRLMEFNVRFGDPETQVMLGLLNGDLAETLIQAANGNLVTRGLTLKSASSVCVVLAAPGYPEAPHTGSVISGLETASKLPGVVVYHAGTRRDASGQVVTSGGRVLGVTAVGDSLVQAHSRAYAAVREIRFDGMQYRSDIAARALPNPAVPVR